MTISKFFKLLAITVLASVTSAYAGDPDTVPNKPKLTWSGMVAGNAIYDSRQVVEAREGFLLLYPQAPFIDKNGNDINATPSYNQYAMTSRLKATILAPEFKNVRSSAVIETDFTGASNNENNSLRLRHAYVKLEWKQSKLLIGQYWHPLDIPEMIPAVVSLNTGAPFRSFSRQPQIRFDHLVGNMNLVLAATTQRDYVNTGPAGQSYIYLRNSAIPNFNFQIQYKSDNLFAGIAADYKMLSPRLVTDKKYKTNEFTNCYAAAIFGNYEVKKAGIKMQLMVGQCLNDHLMLGGYGISSVDTVTDRRKYSNLNYASSYINLYSKFSGFNCSVFAGYSKNLGSAEPIIAEVYARNPDISAVWRLSPTFSYRLKWLVAATELEYTRAIWGTPDKYYNLAESGSAGNWRFTLQIIYSF